MRHKKSLYFILSLIMTLVFALPTSVSAAGVETWYGDWVNEPTMIITNHNLTPVKTIGKSGTLHVAASISRVQEAYDDLPNIKLTMEIRQTNGKVLARGEVEAGTMLPQVHLSTPVKKGQKIQVYFDISSVSHNPHGNYRKGKVNYSHEIY